MYARAYLVHPKLRALESKPPEEAWALRLDNPQREGVERQQADEDTEHDRDAHASEEEDLADEHREEHDLKLDVPHDLSRASEEGRASGKGVERAKRACSPLD